METTKIHPAKVSASAGVYNEWLYKGIGKDDNIHTSLVEETKELTG